MSLVLAQPGMHGPQPPCILGVNAALLFDPTRPDKLLYLL